jgi:hypothetical protein
VSSPVAAATTVSSPAATTVTSPAAATVTSPAAATPAKAAVSGVDANNAAATRPATRNCIFITTTASLFTIAYLSHLTIEIIDPGSVI